MFSIKKCTVISFIIVKRVLLFIETVIFYEFQSYERLLL